MSFEKTYKSALISPVDLKKLESAIMFSLAHYGWIPVETSAGAVSAKYDKSNGIMAKIRITYGNDSFQIEYVESSGLNVDITQTTIHPNYVRWIQNLMKSINVMYSKSFSVLP